MSAKWALIIANTDYTDPKLAKLTAPTQDAEAFAQVLRAPDLAAFDDVTTLINQPESVARRAMAKFFTNRRPDDLLLLYFSGHGVRDEQGRLFLAMPDTDSSVLDATAVSSEFVTRQMDNSRSKRQLLILDCCNSGAFASGTKGATGATMGTGGAFEGTGYGRVVLTATDSTQFAWEGDKIIGGETTNSLFTHFLVKGLEGEADSAGDSIITVDELYDYVYGEVVKRTPKQTPGKWSYKEQGEIVLSTKVRPQTIKPLPLDPDLEQDLQSSRNYVRDAAVNELGSILNGSNLGRALSAAMKLKYVAENDDSRAIASKATLLLEQYQASRGIPVPIPPVSPPGTQAPVAGLEGVSNESLPGKPALSLSVAARNVESHLKLAPPTEPESPLNEPFLAEHVPSLLAEANKIESRVEPVSELKASPFGRRKYALIAGIGVILLGVIALAWSGLRRAPAAPIAPSQNGQIPVAISSGPPATAIGTASGVASNVSPQEGTWGIDYFANTELSGSPVYHSTQASQKNTEGGDSLQFQTADLHSIPLIPTGNLSIRLSGLFYFAGGTYDFECQHLDGCRVYVDGVRRIDAWSDGSGTHDATANVTAGNHAVSIEYYNKSIQGSLQVTWRIQQQATPSPSATATATSTATRLPTAIPAPTKKPKGPGGSICLAFGTQIDTPYGPVPVQDLAVGQLVWTQDASGARVAMPIVQRRHVPVPADTELLHLVLSDGREVRVSSPHPTADGRPIGSIQRGDWLDGARVVRIEHFFYSYAHTYDILPAGFTGVYWADGILLGSTLKYQVVP